MAGIISTIGDMRYCIGATKKLLSKDRRLSGAGCSCQGELFAIRAFKTPVNKAEA
jgi:hypothetical protein